MMMMDAMPIRAPRQVWGRSVRLSGQKVGLAHGLMDEDILTFVTKQ
jgi:ribosome-interacting GTPase 1